MTVPLKTSTMPSPLEAAREYLRRGWRVVPIPQGEKGPRIPGWVNLSLTESDLPTYFSDGSNIGIILGGASCEVCDVDLDASEALAVADSFLPQTDFIFGHASKPRSHRFFLAHPLPSPRKFTASDGTTLVELRANGQQTVAPPSLHPSGELYEFYEYGEAARVDGKDLAQCVRTIAAAALLARHWPAEGQRHDAALAVAGMLEREGWSLERVREFVEAIAGAAHDTESGDRLRGVDSTAQRLETGRTATGAPTLAQIVGDDVLRRVREWLRLTSELPSQGVTWPDPAQLGDELLAVPAFDLELLPSSFRPLVADISDRMQAPADYAGAAAIVALAGCVNRRAVVIPKKQDASWSVVPNLWGAITAPPGMMKSPILRAVTLPLTGIEEKWRTDYKNESVAFEIEREQVEARKQVFREQTKQAIKKHESLPIPPDTSLRQPVQRRLVLTDATYEKLHEILEQNPAGVLVIRDELTGWLSELGRSGREGERAFFLQAWNGDGGFTVDRIGRGTKHVSAVCVSLLGNIQPSRLRAYLAEATAGGIGDDGLFQRFQVLVWPDPPRNWRLVDRPANDSAFQTAQRVFDLLANLPSDNPICLRFVEEAQELFYVWLGELEGKVRGDSGLAPPFVSHLAKFRSLLPSLAGLFELADIAASGEVPSGEVLISVVHAKQAAALCDYLEAHAKRAYGCVISPETQNARELARHIQAGDLPSPFTTRAIYLKGWSGLKSPEYVRGALELLAEAGWCCRAETPSSAVGGRPSEVWLVNPKVKEVRRA